MEELWHISANFIPQLKVLAFALLLKQDHDTVQKAAHVKELIDEIEILIIVELSQILNVFNHRENEFKTPIDVLHILHQTWLLFNEELDNVDRSLNAIERRLQVVDD